MEMGSASEEDVSDRQSDRCGSYSPSADVSESESSVEFRPVSGVGTSSSFASSPLLAKARPQAPPMIPGADLVFWEGKPERREPDFAGLFTGFLKR